MSNWYRVGTIAVTSGSTTVTGTTTAWLNQVKEGDLIIFANGTLGEIAADPVNNTTLTLRTAYVGTTGSGQAYAIARFSDGWRPTAELALRVANFLASAVQIFSGNGVPAAGLGGDGSVYFRQDVPQYFTKSGGAWSAPISLLGPPGPAGAGFSVTSTTSNAIGTGSRSFTIASGGLSYLGARMRAAVTASPTNFVEGIVTAATATSVTVNADAIGGSGTHAAWSLVVAGDRGSQGPPGSPSTGASASSVAIGTGNLTFAVPAGLDLVVGQRVRFSATAAPTTQWVEGIITAYAGGSMTINVANDGISTAGSGTVASWTFGIIGSRGLTGPAGAASSVPGPVGPSYNATSTSSVTIGTGNRVFAIGTNTAYLPGSRVRAASTATPVTHWMEGESVTYTAGNITIAVDLVGSGTGTLSSWNLSLAGERGSAGIDGDDGTSLLPVGNYDAGTVYSSGRVVRLGGASWAYINTTPGSGNSPPAIPIESNSHWQLVARDGVDGTGTVNSVNGLSGDVVLTPGSVQVFTVSDDWSRPSGCRAIKATIVAGGGGGGGAPGVASQCGAGAGGGAGGVSILWLDVTTITLVPVTIGAGGAGGVSNQSGASGGSSSFGSYASATGGSGGFVGTSSSAVGANNGGTAGTGSGGNVNFGVAPGGSGIRLGGAVGVSGAGGSGPYGSGGRSQASDANGNSAAGFGAGGSGACSRSATNRTGGNGAGGIVIVEEFY